VHLKQRCGAFPSRLSRFLKREARNVLTSSILIALLYASTFTLTFHAARAGSSSIHALQDAERRLLNSVEYIMGNNASCIGSEYEGFVEGGLVNGTTIAFDDDFLYTDSNARVAKAFCSCQNRFDADGSVLGGMKRALSFVVSAQTPRRDFYLYYAPENASQVKKGYDQKGWHYCSWDRREEIKPSRLYFWNAPILEALAHIGFTKLREDPLRGDSAYYHDLVKRVEECVEVWKTACEEPNGAWVTAKPCLDPVKGHFDAEDTVIDANGYLLATFTWLSLYERQFGDAGKGAEYSESAQRVARWLLERQELQPDGEFPQGGFYHNAAHTAMYTDSNGRAALSLLVYASHIDQIAVSPHPSRPEILERLELWADAFIPRMVDSHYGPYWFYSIDVTQGWRPGLVQYPKEVYRASVLGTALAELSHLRGDPKFLDRAVKFYRWMTGENEVPVDLQSGVNRRGVRNGFCVGIHKLDEQDIPHALPGSNIETNAEAITFMAALIEVRDTAYTATSTSISASSTATSYPPQTASVGIPGFPIASLIIGALIALPLFLVKRSAWLKLRETETLENTHPPHRCSTLSNEG
jgi:hypothetical protein